MCMVWSRDSRCTTSVADQAHENVRVLMTRGYVDDSLLTSSGSGVSLAVWNRGSGC